MLVDHFRVVRAILRLFQCYFERYEKLINKCILDNEKKFYVLSEIYW